MKNDNLQQQKKQVRFGDWPITAAPLKVPPPSLTRGRVPPPGPAAVQQHLPPAPTMKIRSGSVPLPDPAEWCYNVRCQVHHHRLCDCPLRVTREAPGVVSDRALLMGKPVLAPPPPLTPRMEAPPQTELQQQEPVGEWHLGMEIEYKSASYDSWIPGVVGGIRDDGRLRLMHPNGGGVLKECAPPDCVRAKTPEDKNEVPRTVRAGPVQPDTMEGDIPVGLAGYLGTPLTPRTGASTTMQRIEEIKQKKAAPPGPPVGEPTAKKGPVTPPRDQIRVPLPRPTVVSKMAMPKTPPREVVPQEVVTAEVEQPGDDGEDAPGSVHSQDSGGLGSAEEGGADLTCPPDQTADQAPTMSWLASGPPPPVKTEPLSPGPETAIQREERLEAEIRRLQAEVGQLRQHAENNREDQEEQEAQVKTEMQEEDGDEDTETIVSPLLGEEEASAEDMLLFAPAQGPPPATAVPVVFCCFFSREGTRDGKRWKCRYGNKCRYVHSHISPVQQVILSTGQGRLICNRANERGFCEYAGRSHV